jgi:hypothetical protein
MRGAKIILVALTAALLCATFAVGARADTQSSKRTVVTFKEPVEIPGQVLPAGKYTVELMENMVNRNVVQFFNGDRTHLVATVLAINNYRMEPTDESVMTFAERPANAPSALKAWFYPGNRWGQEFVYPKERAVQLAQVTNEPIPAVESVPATVEELKTEPIIVETPQQTEVAVAEFPPFMPHETGNLTEPPLPQTASPVPMIAVLGIAAVGVGFMLRRFAS